MTNRRDFWPDLSHTISTWTVPGITCNGDEDRRNLTRFLRDHPLIEQAVAKHIERGAMVDPDVVASSIGDGQSARSYNGTAAPRSKFPFHAYHHSPLPDPVSSAVRPLAPTQMSEAIEKFVDRKFGTGVNNARTLRDKRYLLVELATFVSRFQPELGTDPFLHEINARHLSDFISDQAKRPAKARGKNSIKNIPGPQLGHNGARPVSGKPEALAPLTLTKKISDLRTFFSYALDELKAVIDDPTSGLASLGRDYKKKGKKDGFHYSPFSDSHLAQIFEPRALLSRSRDPDHFWSPLIGLYLGLRLGEIVTLSMDAVGFDQNLGIWYVDVKPEEAKNPNSVRRLPITKPLVDLGFVEYIQHLRASGATHLFPHRDMTTPTALEKPSKVCSERFGEYLDTLGIVDRALVFHSFRHTAVSALQDAGVPLSDAMQICGHEAQSHAISTGRMTAKQALSVHLKVYTHSDIARMSVEYPLLRLKASLEKAIVPSIDLVGLRIAADIVREHLVKNGKVFKSGWPPQRKAYTQSQLDRIGASTAAVGLRSVVAD